MYPNTFVSIFLSRNSYLFGDLFEFNRHGLNCPTEFLPFPDLTDGYYNLQNFEHWNSFHHTRRSMILKSILKISSNSYLTIIFNRGCDWKIAMMSRNRYTSVLIQLALCCSVIVIHHTPVHILFLEFLSIPSCAGLVCD